MSPFGKDGSGALGRQPTIEDGVRGEALALESVASLPLNDGTGLTIGSWSHWLGGVSLQVRVPGREPSYPTPRRWMSRAKFPIAGTTLPVTVDRNDPSILRIEWDDVPEIDEWIAGGHPVFTDPDSVEAVLREGLEARSAAAIDAANRSAVDHAAALMGPGYDLDRELLSRAIDRTQDEAQAPASVLKRQPIDGASARILAVGWESDGDGSSARSVHGEILLSVANPGWPRFGIRWKGWIPQGKVHAYGWDVPVTVEMGKPPKVKILWDQVPGVEIVTPLLHEANDRMEALLSAPPQGIEAYQGLLSAITDPARRAQVEQQLAEGLRRATGPAAPAAAPDPLEELKRIGQLRATGALSEAEFAAEKARLLAMM